MFAISSKHTNFSLRLGRRWTCGINSLSLSFVPSMFSFQFYTHFSPFLIDWSGAASVWGSREVLDLIMFLYASLLLHYSRLVQFFYLFNPFSARWSLEVVLWICVYQNRSFHCWFHTSSEITECFLTQFKKKSSSYFEKKKTIFTSPNFTYCKLWCCFTLFNINSALSTVQYWDFSIQYRLCTVP